MGNRKFFDAAIVFTAISGLVYFGTYLELAGEYENYDLPKYLIDVNVVNILRYCSFSLAVVLMPVLITFFTFTIINFFLNLNPAASLVMLYLLSVISIMIFVMAPANFIFSNNHILNASSILFILMISVIFTVYKFQSSELKAKTNTKKLQLFFYYQNIPWYNYLVNLILLMAFLIINLNVGNYLSKEQNGYYLCGKGFNTILIGVHNDLYIEKPFSRKNMRLSDTLILKKISDSTPEVIKYQVFGHLKSE